MIVFYTGDILETDVSAWTKNVESEAGNEDRLTRA